MGMAASQARYLALTARKTNTEWEGQQINQARTALANQSANLFNRLLDLEVPNAPKTTDYTELQYSFSDGDNESVIDSWQQLSSANPDYNYIVNHYYFANIYTGSKKQLEDPQVHTEDEIVANNFVNPSVVWNDDGTCTVTFPNGATTTLDEITNEKAEKDDELTVEFNDFAKAKELAYEAGAIPSGEVYGYQDATGTWHFFLKEEIDDIEAMKPEVSLDPVNNTYTVTTADGSETFTYEPLDDIERDRKFETALAEFKDAMKASGQEVTDADIYTYHDEKGNWHFFVPDDLENPKEYTSESVTWIGNCRADELKTFDKDQAAELAQILRDCPDSSMAQYLEFDNQGNLIYNGQGIYTFTMNGNTYFTTEADLYNSMNTAYESPEKPIDIQNRLNYYNASYIKKKIEGTNHALLETDGNGRFTSVKFDNDSVVYSLNVETVTDEAAYKDAMNEYLYKKEQYEKTIADINAQTSIIQQEDRTLELRLKQLDTEQNALATEMDAVKKVIKDNVEKTFKTFSD